MSCFQGQMNEYKNFALDRFDGKNLRCTGFFLSHCHKDHMVGLNASALQERLKSRDNVYLYCTEISRLLLLADVEYRHLEKFIRVLDVGESCHICVPAGRDNTKDTYVSVTPISAGHCLGSVMFLFEGGEGTVLYTGDFRWEVDQASRISAFWYLGSVKTIQSVYVDTTFCIPEAFHIPSRNECVEAAYSLISDWLDKDRCNAVSISCPARYGHEHFLLELAKRLNTKVHVPSWKVDVYNNVPDLKGYFTDDASEAKLHSCATRSGFTKTYVLPCGYRLPGGERLRLLNIRPSTMWFTSTKTKCSTGDLVVSPATHRGLHRVCYSMHSSYSEIRDLVSFLRPQKVSPNVLPASDKDMTTVHKRLESFIDHPNKFRLQAPSNSNDDQNVLKPLGTLRQIHKAATNYSRTESLESGSDDLVFSSQELTPSKSNTSLHHRTNTPTSKNTAVPSSPSWRQVSKSPITPSSPSSRQDISIESHSSYSGSLNGQDDREINLFSDEDERDEKEERFEDSTDHVEPKRHSGKEMVDRDEGESRDGSKESLRSYVSGESDVGDDADDEDDEDERDKSKDVRFQNFSERPTNINCDRNSSDSNMELNSPSVNDEGNIIDCYVGIGNKCDSNVDAGVNEHLAPVDVDDDGTGISGGDVRKMAEEEFVDTVSYDVNDSNIHTDDVGGHDLNSTATDIEDKECGGVVGGRKDDSYTCLPVCNDEGGIVSSDNKSNEGVDNNGHDDEDDFDIIPNSQETVAKVKSSNRFVTGTDNMKSKISLLKQDANLKNTLSPTPVASDRMKDKNVTNDNIDRDDDLKLVYECSDNNYCLLSEDSDMDDKELDKDCEIVGEEKLKSNILLTSGNKDFLVIHKHSKDNSQVSNSSSGSRSDQSAKPSVVSDNVIDVEEQASLEEDSGECVEFLFEDNKSTSPVKSGWLSKKTKTRNQGLNIDYSSTIKTLNSQSNACSSTVVCESKGFRKRRKSCDESQSQESQGMSWTSKAKKGNIKDNSRQEEDFYQNQFVEEKKESIVDLTLDDST